MNQTQQTSLFTTIDHPAISCDEPASLIDWYCRVLGMRIIASDGKTPVCAIVGYGSSTTDGPMIELMPRRDAGPRPADVPRFAQGLRHLALRVRDFDAAYQHLKDAGVTFLSEPLEAIGGGRIVSFRDPEGNELQIVQR